MPGEGVRDRATGARSRLARVCAGAGLTLALVVLAGCPGEKPAAERGKRPTKGGKGAAARTPARQETSGQGLAEYAAFGMSDAACYVRAKPAALVGSQAFKRAIEGAQKLGLVPAAPLEETIRKKTGVDVDQVVAVRAAVAADGKRFLLAALFKSPYDAGKIMETGLRKSDSYKGVDLLRPGGAEEKTVLALVSPTVLAGGELEAIKSSIDRMKAASSSGLPPAARELVESAPEAASLVVVIPSLADLAKAQADRGLQVTADVGDLRGMLLAVTPGENFDIRVQVYAADADGANQARADAQASLDQFRTQPNPMLDTPEMAPLKDLIESIRIGGTGAAIEVTATVKPELVSAVPALMGSFLGGMVRGAGAAAADEDFDFDADFE